MGRKVPNDELARANRPATVGTNGAADRASVLPGPIRQIAYVVRDIDAAMQSWLSLGVGPWFTIRDFVRREGTYRGEPSEARLSVAFANSRELQVELIQPLDDSPGTQRDFLNSGREGFHHVAYWAENFDEVVAAAAEAGWSAVQTSAGRSVYYEFGGPLELMVEVMELNERTKWTTDTVRQAAQEWDGVTDPIRDLPKRPGW